MKVNNPPTFLFAGGGTGGHLFPGIAAAEELLTRIPTARILFAGSERDVEAAIVKAAGFRHVVLPSPPSTMLRRHPLRFVAQYFRAYRAARRMIAESRPSAVIGLGGFASVPLVTAAGKAGVPVVLLEQNAVAGRATRRLARFARFVCHSFQSAIPPGKAGRNAVVTGNPVRAAIARLKKLAGADSSPTLLVLGGSQGSTAVNEAMLSAAKLLQEHLRGWEVHHQCGPNDGERISTAYRRLEIAHVVRPFFDDMPPRYAAADVAVTRAGATTLAELACAGVPAVLLPYPNAIYDHQVRNSGAFAAAGAACVVQQQRSADETGRQLAAALQPLLCDRERLHRRAAAMRALADPDAAANVAERILAAATLSWPPRGSDAQSVRPAPGMAIGALDLTRRSRIPS